MGPLCASVVGPVIVFLYIGEPGEKTCYNCCREVLYNFLSGVVLAYQICIMYIGLEVEEDLLVEEVLEPVFLGGLCLTSACVFVLCLCFCWRVGLLCNLNIPHILQFLLF